MNKLITIKLKYILLFIVAFCVLGYLAFSPCNEIASVDVEKSSTTEIINKVDSTSINIAAKKPFKTIEFLVDSISNVYRKKPTKKEVTEHKKESKKPTEKTILAKEYKGEIQLENAKIMYSLVSPCKVLGFDVKAFTEDKLTTNTITTTITKYKTKNVWFLNYEPKFTIFPLPALVGHEVSIDYTIKDKFRIGSGIEYNSLMPTNNKVLFNFKIGIRL